MGDVKVEAKGLRKRYGEVVAVDGVDLAVHGGEIVGIVGPNGAGKTTTIEMMEGLRVPDEGWCKVCGFDTIREHRRVRRLVGLALQNSAMPHGTTVQELLRLYASFYKNPVRIGDLLDQFALMDRARTRVERLSGGQQRRLALALAVIGRPEVVFLDEPTTGLDPQARRNLWDVIRRLKDAGRAIILSTHYMDEVESLCSRAVVMDGGRVLAEGPPADLTERYGPESVVEVEFAGAGVDSVSLAGLDGVTGINTEGNLIRLHTAAPPATLMALARHVQESGFKMRSLRTRTATMDDVFIALTGKGVRD